MSARADNDWCCKAWAEGLEPGRWYYYRFTAPDGSHSDAEVTDACNLKCPVCYAESGPHRPGFRSLSQIEFMLDAENNYDLESSIRVAAELEELQFRWFEAPLMDYDLPGYRTLTALDQVPIIPSGNWIQDLTSFQYALDSKCWTEARTISVI